MNEDFDIYANLPDQCSLSLESEKLQEQVKLLEERSESLEGDVDKLCAKLIEMKKVRDNLAKNISELFKTAKAEIERKDRTIRELRNQIDQQVLQKRAAFVPSKRPPENSPSLENEPHLKRSRREGYSPSRPKKSRSRSRSRERHHRHVRDDYRRDYRSGDRQPSSYERYESKPDRDSFRGGCHKTRMGYGKVGSEDRERTLREDTAGEKRSKSLETDCFVAATKSKLKTVSGENKHKVVTKEVVSTGRVGEEKVLDNTKPSGIIKKEKSGESEMDTQKGDTTNKQIKEKCNKESGIDKATKEDNIKVGGVTKHGSLVIKEEKSAESKIDNQGDVTTKEDTVKASGTTKEQTTGRQELSTKEDNIKRSGGSKQGSGVIKEEKSVQSMDVTKKEDIKSVVNKDKVDKQGTVVKKASKCDIKESELIVLKTQSNEMPVKEDNKPLKASDTNSSKDTTKKEKQITATDKIPTAEVTRTVKVLLPQIQDPKNSNTDKVVEESTTPKTEGDNKNQKQKKPVDRNKKGGRIMDVATKLRDRLSAEHGAESLDPELMDHVKKAAFSDTKDEEDDKSASNRTENEQVKAVSEGFLEKEHKQSIEDMNKELERKSVRTLEKEDKQSVSDRKKKVEQKIVRSLDSEDKQSVEKKKKKVEEDKQLVENKKNNIEQETVRSLQKVDRQSVENKKKNAEEGTVGSLDSEDKQSVEKKKKKVEEVKQLVENKKKNVEATVRSLEKDDKAPVENKKKIEEKTVRSLEKEDKQSVVENKKKKVEEDKQLVENNEKNIEPETVRSLEKEDKQLVENQKKNVEEETVRSLEKEDKEPVENKKKKIEETTVRSLEKEDNQSVADKKKEKEGKRVQDDQNQLPEQPSEESTTCKQTQALIQSLVSDRRRSIDKPAKPPSKKTQSRKHQESKIPEKLDEEVRESDRVLRSAARRNSTKIEKSNESLTETPSNVSLTHEEDIPVLHIADNEPHLDTSLASNVATSSPLRGSVDLQLLKDDLNISLDQSLVNSSQNDSNRSDSTQRISLNTSSARKRRRVVITIID